MDLQTITITQYLTQKDISFIERNGEIVTRCLFNECDKDSRPNEAHLYFHVETGQYNCKKCGVKGNLITLAKHLGDNTEYHQPNHIRQRKPKETSVPILRPEMVEEYHRAIPERIMSYLSSRGLTEALVTQYRLGWGKFYGQWWITIPIKDKDGIYSFFKLRRDPDIVHGDGKYRFYPSGSEASLFGVDTLTEDDDTVMICEGEFDAILMRSKLGIPVLTSTAGAGTFKEEWIGHFTHVKKLYVCFDIDEAGQRGSDAVIQLLATHLPKTTIYKSTFPDRMTDGKDITDYITRYNGNPDELIYQYSKQVAGKEPIDTSQFTPMTSKDVLEVLGLTIKKDEENKLITFMAMLSAFTEQSQFNISFNAPSSTGKSFIPMEVSSLFPQEDVMKLGNCSPTALFHEQGTYDKERNVITVDLSRKILIFLDQPHTALLEKLRSLLSHDQKEMVSKITDKNQKGGNRTKTVIIRGYPAVIFCSAGLKIDEQESTRFILLSPETSQEKFRFAIQEKIKKESDFQAYAQSINANPQRQQLIRRIEAIRDERIEDIRINNTDIITDAFFNDKPMLKPRHQRDAGRLVALTKIFALLNVWFRERDGSTIVATDDDFRSAVEIWSNISESQEYNLPPYILEMYKKVLIPAYQEKNLFGLANPKFGITRQELMQKHFSVYGRMIQDWQLRQDVIPMLETAGLITQEADIDDKRKILITPTVLFEDTSLKDIVSSTVGTHVLKA